MNLHLINSGARLAFRVTPGRCHNGLSWPWVRDHSRGQSALHLGALWLAPVGVFQRLEGSRLSESHFPRDWFTEGSVCEKPVPQTSSYRRAIRVSSQFTRHFILTTIEIEFLSFPNIYLNFAFLAIKN